MSNAENSSKPVNPIIHEGPSVSIPANKISFINTGVKDGQGRTSCRSSLWRSSEWPSWSLRPNVRRIQEPLHTHTEDYFAVEVEGVGSNRPVGAE